MGDSTSANHEWIELHNDGSEAVTVDGWSIRDGMNLEIVLSGVIGANDFAVLERTNEESAPGAAFLIYTGALVNTGATLTLFDAGGVVMDQVSGGENWEQIGGDNSTKETAQYTSAGWFTDIPTPGKVNGSGRTENADDSTEETDDHDEEVDITTSKANPVSKSSRGETVRLTVSDAVLKLVPDMQKVVYVNQGIAFSVLASNIGEHIIDSLVYTWNFGDTYTKIGKSVEHSYAYPGTYVVTIRGVFGRHDQVVRQEITVLPVNFSLTKNTNGDVQINNNAPYDIDISGYMLEGGKSVIMPEHTIVVAKGTITIAARRLAAVSGTKTTALYDQMRNLLATTEASSLPVAVNTNLVTQKIVATMPVITPPQKALSVAADETNSQTGNFNFVTAIEKLGIPVAVAATAISTSAASLKEGEIHEAQFQSAAVIESAAATATTSSLPPGQTEKQWPYVALIGLLGIALLALLLQTKKSETPAPLLP
jgi:PKD domain